MSIAQVMASNHLNLCCPLLLPLIFPSIRIFPMSQLFASGGQSIGDSASVLPMSIQGWFPLRLTGLISFMYNGLSEVFSSTKVQKHPFFHALPCFWFSSQQLYLTTGKTITLTIKTFVGSHSINARSLASPHWCWIESESVSLNLTLDRVWGEVEKNSFVALPGKGENRWCVPMKKMPQQGGSGKEFYSTDSMAELLIDDGVCRVCAPLTWLQIISWWLFLIPFNLVSDGLLWNEECWPLFIEGFISICIHDEIYVCCFFWNLCASFVFWCYKTYKNGKCFTYPKKDLWGAC